MASFSVQYIFTLVDRFTPGAGKLAAAATRIRGALAAAGSSMMGFVRAAGLAAAALGVLGAAFVLGGVKQAAAFEDAMANVRRVTDITRQEMLDYGKDALKIGVATGQSGEQIAGIMKNAAMMGLRGRETLGAFAEVVSQVAVAWDDISTEQAADQLARLTAKFFGDKSPAEQAANIRDVADAINELANRSAFKAPELLKFFDRGSAAAQRFGLTAQQAAAYGGAALVLGEPTGELQGTRARMTFQRLINATTGAVSSKGKLTKLGQSFKALGMTQKHFAELVNNDPQRAILTLLDKFNKMDKTAAQQAADGIFDSRSSAQFLSIAQNVNEYKRQLAIADDEWAKELTQDKEFMDWLRNGAEGNKELSDQLERYGRIASRMGSVQREFAKRTETLNFAWKQLGLSFDRVQILAAMPLLEPLRNITNGLTGVMNRLGDFAQDSPQIFSSLMNGLGSAAILGAGYGLLQLTAWMTGAATAGAALKALGLITLKFAVLAIGIAAAYWVYDNWAKLKELAADPLKFDIIFPGAPDWLKRFMKWYGDKRARADAMANAKTASEAYDIAFPSSVPQLTGYENVVNLQAFREAQRIADEARRTYTPFQQMQGISLPEQSWAQSVAGYNPTWGTNDRFGGTGNPAFSAAQIPQSMAVNVTSHTSFDPASINVIVTGTVNGPVNGTGSGTINAKPARGVSAGDAGAPSAP